MATKFVLLSMASGVLSQAFAGSGSTPGTGAIGGGGAAGEAGGAPAPSVQLPKPQTVLPMIVLGINPQPIVASIVAAPNAQTTTIALLCPPGTPADMCELPPSGGMTVEHISSSIFRASLAVPGRPGTTASVSWGCTVTSVAGLPAAPTALPPALGQPSANAAVCAQSVGGEGISKTGQTTTTIAAPTMYALIQGVGVTAGAEKLAVTAGAGSSSAASSPSGSSAAGTTAGAAVAGGAASTSTSSGAAASLSSAASSISASVSSQTSAAVSSATKAAANATASAAATTAGAAKGSVVSGFLISTVSAVIFGSLLYIL